VSKLQVGRFERLAARTYSIKGPGSLIDLDETVLGVIQLERQAGMEAHMIQSWDTFQVFKWSGEAVGNYRYFMLSNPVGSNRIAVLDWYRHGADRRMDIFITRGIPPGFSVVATGGPVDTRIPSSMQPACEFHTLLTAASTFGRQIGICNNDLQQEFKVVLGEDGSVVWRTGSQNQDLQLTVRWAERDSAPFEK